MPHPIPSGMIRQACNKPILLIAEEYPPLMENFLQSIQDIGA
jgi:hypothetical protein